MGSVELDKLQFHFGWCRWKLGRSHNRYFSSIDAIHHGKHGPWRRRRSQWRCRNRGVGWFLRKATCHGTLPAGRDETGTTSRQTCSICQSRFEPQSGLGLPGAPGLFRRRTTLDHPSQGTLGNGNVHPTRTKTRSAKQCLCRFSACLQRRIRPTGQSFTSCDSRSSQAGVEFVGSGDTGGRSCYASGPKRVSTSCRCTSCPSTRSRCQLVGL